MLPEIGLLHETARTAADRSTGRDRALHAGDAASYRLTVHLGRLAGADWAADGTYGDRRNALVVDTILPSQATRIATLVLPETKVAAGALDFIDA